MCGHSLEALTNPFSALYTLCLSLVNLPVLGVTVTA